MKTNYIKPTILVRECCAAPMLQALSQGKTKTSAWDAQDVESNTLGVDNYASSPVTMESKGQNFGSESGPWESIW